MDGMQHHTPQAEGLGIGEPGNRRTVAIGGHQAEVVATSAQPPQQEGIAMDRHHHHARAGIHAAIDHQQIPRMDALTPQRPIADPPEEGGERPGDERHGQIDAGFPVVVRRTGEARGRGMGWHGMD